MQVSLHKNSILSMLQGANSSQQVTMGKAVLEKGTEVRGLGKCGSIARQHKGPLEVSCQRSQIYAFGFCQMSTKEEEKGKRIEVVVRRVMLMLNHGILSG